MYTIKDLTKEEIEGLKDAQILDLLFRKNTEKIVAEFKEKNKVEIKQWEAKAKTHDADAGLIFVSVNATQRVFVFREPSITDLDRALTAGRSGELKFARTIYQDCILHEPENATSKDKIACVYALNAEVTVLQAGVVKS